MVMQNICTQIIFQGLKLAFIRKTVFPHARLYSHTHTQRQTQIWPSYNFGFIKQKVASIWRIFACM